MTVKEFFKANKIKTHRNDFEAVHVYDNEGEILHTGRKGEVMKLFGQRELGGFDVYDTICFNGSHYPKVDIFLK